MSTPKPATTEADIRAKIKPLLIEGGKVRSKDDLVVARIFREIDILQRADAAGASLLMAEALQLVGDIDGIVYWLNNAEKLGRRQDSTIVSVISHANLGFVSKAAANFAEVVAVERGRVNEHLSLGLACASFSAICKAADALKRAGGRVENEGVVMLAQEVLDVLNRLKVPEADVQALLDRAGDVMKQRALLWLNVHPDYIYSPKGSDPFVAIRYRVKTSPLVASEMTWDLAEQLASVDLMPENVTVSFIGVENGEGVAT